MYGVRDDTRCQWVSASWPLNVQYVGEGVVSWTDVVGVKGWCQGVRDAKESVSWKVASFLLACLVVPAGDVAGVVASMECSQQGMSSSSCDESLSGRVFLWYRLWLMMFPVD